MASSLACYFIFFQSIPGFPTLMVMGELCLDCLSYSQWESGVPSKSRHTPSKCTFVLRGWLLNRYETRKEHRPEASLQRHSGLRCRPHLYSLPLSLSLSSLSFLVVSPSVAAILYQMQLIVRILGISPSNPTAKLRWLGGDNLVMLPITQPRGVVKLTP